MRHIRSTFAFVALALAVPQIASAHTELVASTPAANSTVSGPSTIVLRFEEPVVAATTQAEIAMTGMANHATMPVTNFTSRMGSDRKTLTLTLAAPLSRGTYRVNWSAAGGDTHRVTGNFTFTVR